MVTIVSAFVKEAYQLRSTGVTDTSNLSYIEQGQFTEDFIESNLDLAQYLVSDVGFEGKEVIEVLRINLVVAPINESEYFMPCVLPYCPTESIDKKTSTQWVATKVIKLPGECVPRGFFCALVCSLLNLPQWKLCHDESTGVFKNYIHFDIENMGCSVAIVDFFVFISVHVFGDCGRKGCKVICDNVRESVESVVTKHNYEEKLMSYDEDVNFLCLCGKSPKHIATLVNYEPGKLKLICSMDRLGDKRLKLSKKHAVWFSEEQYSEWEQQCQGMHYMCNYDHESQA